RPVATGGGLVRLYAPARAFVGLGRLNQVGSAVKPDRILHGDYPRPRVLPA
ncbi:MAG: tRNA pseudouridine(55) synthase TruB, partial [Candidatus Rokubacteria bacterium]|nr:tRNA pseudouridine(55) synthase TruB [Candidatus Rokubacteria bacterium]